MILKTAYRNFRRHLIGRALYIVAISLLIMVAYASLAAYNDRKLQQMVSFGGIFVLLIILFVTIVLFSFAIIVYANRFFMKQQHQEMGVLLVSGLTHPQLALLFSAENLMGEGLQLGIGLVLGLLFSKLYNMLLLRLMGVVAETNHWFSGSALLITAGSFVGVFILVALVDSARIIRLKMVRLLYPENSHRHRLQTPLNRFLAWLGPVLLLACYCILLRFNWFQFLETLRFNQPGSYATYFIILTLLLGVWLTYRNGLPTLLHWLRSRHNGFARRHLLDFAFTEDKFVEHYQSLTLTTLFVTASIVMLGLAAVLFAFGNRTVQEETPIDFVTDHQHQETILKKIRTHGGKSKQLTNFTIKITAAQLQGPHAQKIMQGHALPLEIISLQDYRNARRHQRNLPLLNLTEDQALYVSRDFYLQHLPVSVLLQNKIQLAQKKIPKLQIAAYSRAYPLGGYLFFDRLLVVSDTVFKQITTRHSRELLAYSVRKIAPAGKTLNDIDEASYVDDAVRQLQFVDAKKLSQVKMHIYQGRDHDKVAQYESNNFYVRGPTHVLMQRALGLTVFVVGTLGVLMTFAWASIFSLRQLAEADNDRYEYLTLKKMGINQAKINQIISTHNRLIYLLPVIFGIANGLLIMKVIGGNLDHLQLGLLYALTLAVLVIYGAFHIFTVHRYRRIVELTRTSEQRPR
ncbi:FtsX-like permease family protein [Lapidilactobacillus bayanensis]|uniref:FtsX-like permease family protein n=1 Tax=Lapidilactobacillus bayanensis TaxID=2485998 RepID=UPI0013DE4486|nr:FtsX-like permease family protein [Lapidilactobacillus bayanensis]